jgi:hypothetical protein
MYNCVGIFGQDNKFAEVCVQLQSANSGLSARLGESVKASSLRSSIANLALGVLGAGQLTLPFAIKGAGIMLGSTILFILGCLAVYTLHLLHRCQAATGQSNYGGMAKASPRR